MAEVISSISVADCNEISRLVDIAVTVLKKEWRGKRVGATFHIRNEKKHVLYNERSGRADKDDACRYDFFASEKTFRLCEHQEHRLSWQSHDMEKKQFPGAVRFMIGLVAALSGYTWEEDEATTLWVGVKMGWMSKEESFLVASLSNNTRYAELFDMFEAERLAD